MGENAFELTTDEFDRITDFVYRKVGIRFEAKKVYFVSKRIDTRMEALDIASPSDYLRYLKFSDPQGFEFQNLVNLLTVNETYFFRDFLQFEAFAEHCLSEVVARKIAVGDNKIRIWSAGCSTGEEAYTISIILHEMFDDVGQWDVKILASDIDENVLKRAASGDYDLRSVKEVPGEYLTKYFQKGRNGTYHIGKKARELVSFEHLNLSGMSTVRLKKGFDFIFCRNVLIYFDDFSRKKIVDHFYVALNKGGFIFLGPSESVGRISTAFKLKRLGTHLVYCKE
jgi:chemotaxis protein methyltransferase CheR